MYARKSIETAPPAKRSTLYNMIFGMLIGLMFATLAAGIAAALVFTGGLLAPAVAAVAISYTATLSTGALIGLFGGMGFLGIFGGLFGGWLYSQQPDHQLAAKYSPPATLSTTAQTQMTLQTVDTPEKSQEPIAGLDAPSQRRRHLHLHHLRLHQTIKINKRHLH